MSNIYFGSLERYSANRAKHITLVPRRTGRETREDDTRNKSDDRKREKGEHWRIEKEVRGGVGRGEGSREAERKRDFLLCVMY